MTNRIYSVTLAFTPPGPLHTSLLIAPDEASASAMAMQAVLGSMSIGAPLMAVLAVPVDADVLRRMLRAVEGREPGEVVSLVPKPPVGGNISRQDALDMVREQRAAEIRALDAADAATFAGPAVDRLWAGHRRLREEDAICVYGEPIGPPMPDNAA
jgi:hypothetical protein